MSLVVVAFGGRDVEEGGRWWSGGTRRNKAWVNSQPYDG